jgi:hypothetical protein
VYDSTGSRIDSQAISVSYREGGAELDLLSEDRGASRVIVAGDRVNFPEVWVGRTVEITSRLRNGENLRTRLPILACVQRTTLQSGEAESGGDSGPSVVSGRIAGCRMDDSWWIRAMPMFGGDAFRPSFEGQIDPSSGKFTMIASFRGERHVVVVGKGKDPVRSIGVNLRSGRNNDAGVVDLTGLCPDGSAP